MAFVLLAFSICMTGDCVFLPNGWSSVGVPQPHELLTITLGLKHQESKIEKLKSILQEVSDPQNRRYGRYLTKTKSTLL